MYKKRVKFWIRPYRKGSVSARLLADALDGRLIRVANSYFKPRQQDFVINWGNSNDYFDYMAILNRPEAVRIATSKLKTFSALAQAGVPHPPHTTELNTALRWSKEGSWVVGRDLDKGKGGAGVVVYHHGAEPREHKFYTKYIKKKREFRVHVVCGQSIFVQEKLKKKEDGGNYDKYIRSHNRGWCFAFNHFGEKPYPPEIMDIAIRAVSAVGLDFGAVDIAWNEDDGPYVLEVNSAPGIEESSLAAYASAFLRLL